MIGNDDDDAETGHYWIMMHRNKYHNMLTLAKLLVSRWNDGYFPSLLNEAIETNQNTLIGRHLLP